MWHAPEHLCDGFTRRHDTESEHRILRFCPTAQAPSVFALTSNHQGATRIEESSKNGVTLFVAVVSCSVPPRVIYPASIITVHTTDRRWGVLEMQIPRNQIKQHQAETNPEQKQPKRNTPGNNQVVLGDLITLNCQQMHIIFLNRM